MSSVQFKIDDPDSIEKLRHAMNADYRSGLRDGQTLDMIRHWVIAFCFDDGQTSVHELYGSGYFIERDGRQYNAPHTKTVLGELFVKRKLQVVGWDEIVTFVPDFSTEKNSSDYAKRYWEKVKNGEAYADDDDPIDVVPAPTTAPAEDEDRERRMEEQ